jgi:YegS/Rv2252/BmrU family lipid kinase
VSRRTVVIANPRSRNGATGRRMDAVVAKLRATLGEVAIETTRGPRDAERIAREAVGRGALRVLVAGGDGTTSEVVTGLLAGGLAERVELGLLPLGTGGDLARTLGLPRDLDEAIARLARGKTRRVDAGAARFQADDGAERTLFFVNVASAGISGLVTALVNAAPKSLGGTVSFLVGTLRAIVRFEPAGARIRVDGAVVHEGPLTLAVAANGRYFGGGMHVAPEAGIDDGLLDVVWIDGLPKLRLLRELPKLYTGAHLRVSAVHSTRGRVVEIEPLEGTRPLRIEIDGEPLGSLPARFEVLPAALTLVGCEA